MKNKTGVRCTHSYMNEWIQHLHYFVAHILYNACIHSTTYTLFLIHVCLYVHYILHCTCSMFNPTCMYMCGTHIHVHVHVYVKLFMYRIQIKKGINSNYVQYTVVVYMYMYGRHTYIHTYLYIHAYIYMSSNVLHVPVHIHVCM